MKAIKGLLSKLSGSKKLSYDAENIKGYLTDTNILLGNPEILQQYDNIFIPSHVLREVEHLELTRKQDRLLQWQIRRFKRLSKEVDRYVDLTDYTFTLREEWSKDYTDNLLVQIALQENLAMVTNDILLRKKCRLYNITVIEPEQTDFIENKGFQTFEVEQDEFSMLRLDITDNIFKLAINEYAVVNNERDGELIDILKWDGKKLLTLKDQFGKLGEGFNTFHFGEFKPFDEYQIMAMDSIFKNQLTSIRGRAGSGKSVIALNVSWRLVEKEGYKLVVFCNPTTLRDSQELGYYTGSQLEKIMQSAVGSMLKSKFGTEDEVYKQVANGTLEILPFSDLRGYDTGDTKTIVWILESQNLSSDLLKLGLQRISKNTKVIVDGDYTSQVDKDVYSHDNGMKRMSEVFRGKELFGEVELQNIHRSLIAEIADQM